MPVSALCPCLQGSILVGWFWCLCQKPESSWECGLSCPALCRRWTGTIWTLASTVPSVLWLGYSQISLFEASVPAVAIDGHHEGTCLCVIAGRGSQDFSLCQPPVVRYHSVLAAWLHGTCSSLGKTLNSAFLFFMVVLCVWLHWNPFQTLPLTQEFGLANCCLHSGVCRVEIKQSGSSCNQVCFLGGLLAWPLRGYRVHLHNW